MNAIDEAMDEKMERIEAELEWHQAALAEALAALHPFATGAWIPVQSMQIAKSVYSKYQRSST
jgi:hypothetical protein